MNTAIDRITIDPDVCNGKPAVRGLRITVESILDYLSLAFASRLMGHKYSVKETV
jgi:uncharacterized protein (DUF433 family)